MCNTACAQFITIIEASAKWGSPWLGSYFILSFLYLAFMKNCWYVISWHVFFIYRGKFLKCIKSKRNPEMKSQIEMSAKKLKCFIWGCHGNESTSIWSWNDYLLLFYKRAWIIAIQKNFQKSPAIKKINQQINKTRKFLKFWKFEFSTSHEALIKSTCCVSHCLTVL